MRHAMNYKLIAGIIGKIVWLEAILLVPAFCIGMYLKETPAAKGILMSQLCMVMAGAVLWLLGKNAKKGFYSKEGLVTTGLAWIGLSILGGLPFYFSGAIPSFVDCLFETVSGFTTTGSSILTDVEAMPWCLLYWRSFTHWIGGMGVLVFLMAVVPLSGNNEGYTVHILRAESPGPSVGKLAPKMKQTASILYILYIVLTIINIIFLLLGGMPILEALCTAFGTAGTGGFGIKNDSMGSYSSYIQTVTTIFMLIFSVNFSCYYLLLIKKFKNVWKDEELRCFLVIVFSSIILITLNIASQFSSLKEAFHHAAFQVASIISTSGFATVNFDNWPSFSKTILLILMLCGACAGSTGGGLKVSRIILLFKSLRRNFHETLHPTEIRKIRFNEQTVDEKIMKNVNGYLIAYVFIMVLSFLVISLDGFSIETNLSAVFTTFNNVGPGLAGVGPASNFSAYSNLSKLIMVFAMLAGRLELFPILCLFSKSTWKKN